MLDRLSSLIGGLSLMIALCLACFLAAQPPADSLTRDTLLIAPPNKSKEKKINTATPTTSPLKPKLVAADTAKNKLKQPRIPKKRPRKSPLKATLLSAALPGLGQAYNGKIWKTPIVLAAVGGVGYFVVDNATRFNQYKQAYLYRVDNDPTTNDDRFTDQSDASVKLNRDIYQRRLEQTAIGLSAVYLLNIVDAFVDAHLSGFDVDDDLSLRLEATPFGVAAIGFNLNLNPQTIAPVALW